MEAKHHREATEAEAEGEVIASKAAEQERAAVVAWLRREARTLDDGFDGWKVLMRVLAKKIRRGEHLTKLKRGPR